ncbi:MAG: hypothetical protein ACJAW0_000020 [Zhongshania sp.]|jgi:hypothetical protein
MKTDKKRRKRKIYTLRMISAVFEVSVRPAFSTLAV